MVTTRHSRGTGSNEKKDESAPPQTPEIDQNEEDSGVARAVSVSSNRTSARLLRKRVGDELRSKSTGVGVAISAKSNVNKKIIFGDSEKPVAVDKAEEFREEISPSTNQVTKQVSGEDIDQDDDDDDDDDAVEEVQGSTAATNSGLEKLAEKHASARAANLSKKTRKRKSKHAGNDELVDSSLFNDDFFRQVDEEREEESKQRKINASNMGDKMAGRHTTFVVSGDSTVGGVGTCLTPKAVGLNIEVVVLGSNTAADGDSSLSYTGRSLLLEANTEAPSAEVLVYSRASFLPDGSVPLSTRQQQKFKKTGHKSAELQSMPTWKRSKKMRAVAFGTRKQAKPAAIFVKRKG